MARMIKRQKNSIMQKVVVMKHKLYSLLELLIETQFAKVKQIYRVILNICNK